jgi:hypothetical protein
MSTIKNSNVCIKCEKIELEQHTCAISKQGTDDIILISVCAEPGCKIIQFMIVPLPAAVPRERAQSINPMFIN